MVSILRALQSCGKIVLACLAFPVTMDCLAAQPFPEWRASVFLPMGSVWAKAPNVVVGVLRNVRPYGVQDLPNRRPVTDENIKRIYWCTAELDIQLSVKGRVSHLEGIRKYVWGYPEPGCRFHDSLGDKSGRELSIWFIRREGDILRPISDVGTAYRCLLLAPTPDTAGSLTESALGSLLLSPEAYRDGVEDMKGNFPAISAIACSLFGKDECVRKLTDLGNRESQLQFAVCGALKIIYGMECSFQ